eukprot:TRINITY_DN32122_c0_g1_i1.p1 TRINITY_DN32122_c0_g1~~TRINITY_DN32122_c0_g1_i1.p1  ORF type:complete len:429 (+),score=105.37 TRINITY_DN32122_c0_g1_i1:164-1288(+)
MSSSLRLALQLARGAVQAADTPAQPLPVQDAEGAEDAKKKKKCRAEKKRAKQQTSCEDSKWHSFTFPTPLAIEGVKSRKKILLQIQDLGFTYGGKGGGTTPTLTSCSLALSQVSRVLVTGGSGGGKSTLMTILAGALKPTTGTLFSAAGLHVAYVSQDALQDMERVRSENAADHFARLCSRAWARCCEELEHASACLEGSAENSGPRGSTLAEHLQAFGLDLEELSRMEIGDLGETARGSLVLAAALWPRPQVLLLDEPGGLLGCSGIDALLRALQSFKGGVVIACHTRDKETLSSIADEQWTLRGGRLQAPSDAARAASSPLNALAASSPSAEAAKVEILELSRKLKQPEKLADTEIEELMQRLLVLKSRLMF